MEKEITIHHYEDEPETMGWLPGALLNHYWDEHPEYVLSDGSYQENDDETEVSFTLNPPSGAVTIRYRVYRNKDEFEHEFRPNPGDLVLLDVMEAGPAGELAPYGMVLYSKACEAVGKERVLFITAYPEKIRQSPGEAASDCLIAKPPDVALLCTKLVELLGVEQRGEA